MTNQMVLNYILFISFVLFGMSLDSNYISKLVQFARCIWNCILKSTNYFKYTSLDFSEDGYSIFEPGGTNNT